MQVRCAASTVGGPGVFSNIGFRRILSKIRLRVNETDVLAIYDPLQEIAFPLRVKVSNWMKESFDF